MRRLHHGVIIISMVMLVSCSANSVPQQARLSTVAPLPTLTTATRTIPSSSTSSPSPVPPTQIQPTTTPTVIFQIQQPSVSRLMNPSITFLPNIKDELTAVSFVDAQHGWLSYGTALLATDDGGKSWHDIYDAPETITAIDFISLQRGWSLVDEHVFETSDGGTTWNAVASLSAIKVSILDFVDARHGWARRVLDNGLYVLLHTIDGGATWKKVVDVCMTNHYWPGGMLYFVSSRVGWAMCLSDPSAGNEGKELFRTDDGGLRWRSVVRSDFDSKDPYRLSDNGYLAGSFFLDGTHGWYSAHYSTTGWLLKSDDGGQTWKYAGLAGDGRVATDFQYITPTQGYVLIRDGGRTRALVATSDGGATWTQLYPTIAPTEQIHFFDQQQGIATGVPLDAGAIIRTSDAGKTWVQVTAIKADHINVMSFSDPQHGCIEAEKYVSSGSDDSVYYTSDGGYSWNASPNDQHCIPSTAPSAGGWRIFNGQLSSVIDGGKTRALCNFDPHMSPEVVSSVDADHAWFKDNLDHLYVTSDGGTNWTQLN